MRRIIALALAMLMILAACTDKPSPTDAPAPSAAPTAAATAGPTVSPSTEPSTEPEDNASLLASMGVTEQQFLRAARRAAAQLLDRSCANWSHSDWFLDDYYHGHSSADGTAPPMLRRAQAVAAVSLDGAQLRRDGDTLYYTAGIPITAEWRYEEVALDLDERFVTKTVSDGLVTAALENDRLYLTFADTEQAAYYLLGYDDPHFDYEAAGADYSLPGADLQLGTAHPYEVQGLYSDYDDLQIVSLGYDYRPWVMLHTTAGGIELVDVAQCCQYGVFCAMPLPGEFDWHSTEQYEDEYGRSAVIMVDASGRSYDMELLTLAMQNATPDGRWYGVLDEVQTDGGSYARILNLEWYQPDYLAVSVTELDAEVFGANCWINSLGMTDEGIVCTYNVRTEPMTAGTLVFNTCDEMIDGAIHDRMNIKVVAGVSPYGCEDEWVALYKLPVDDVQPTKTDFAGVWQDVNSGRCYMHIYPTDHPATYHIAIYWADSADVEYSWTMTGVLNGYETALDYDDCVVRKMTGQETELISTQGTGCITIERQERLRWQDDEFDRSTTCLFEYAGDGVG